MSGRTSHKPEQIGSSMEIRMSALALASAVAFSALAPAHGAYMGHRHYQKNSNNPPSGQPFWYSAEYVDMSSTSAYSARTWFVGNVGGTTGVKYMYNQLVPGSGASGNQCYEISTAKGAFGNQDAETVNADTRIWIYDVNKSPTDFSISDDFNGTRYSKVRIWANASSNIIYKVAPYSSGSNDIDFFLVTQRLNLADANACKGTGINFVNTTTFPWSYDLPNG